MRIICTGKIANTTVGHIDHALAYAAGFQRLGHEVYLFDYVGRGRCVDASGQRVPFSQWDGRQHFEAIAREYGLGERYSLISWERQTHGMAFVQVLKAAQGAQLLIARSGSMHKLSEVFEAPEQRAFFDGNPGSTQVRFAQQHPDHEPLDRYEHLFTLGFNIGTDACAIPCSSLRWHALPRPVVLPMWPASAADHGRFTTISTWKGRGTFELDGTYSGEKSDNWLDYLTLPARCGQAMEIALMANTEEAAEDIERFTGSGWHISDPTRMRTFADYYRYIAHSRAEFSVAHNRYVRFRTGWFSDRSAAYLACGKPVVVQATGIEAHLPVGKGLLTFNDLDEAQQCVAAVNADYAMHAHAAREIAQGHFDSDRVLARVLEMIR